MTTKAIKTAEALIKTGRYKDAVQYCDRLAKPLLQQKKNIDDLLQVIQGIRQRAEQGAKK